MKTVIFYALFLCVPSVYAQNLLDIGLYSRAPYEYIPYFTAQGHVQVWDTYAVKSFLHLSSVNQTSLVTVGYSQEKTFFIGIGPAVMRDRIPSFGRPFSFWNTEIGPAVIAYADVEKIIVTMQVLVTNTLWYQASVHFSLADNIRIGLVSRNISGTGTGIELEYRFSGITFAAQILHHPDGNLASSGILRIVL